MKSRFPAKNSDYWAPTVSKRAEEDVDARLQSWALNLIPDPPTTVVKGSFPTQLPQILPGFGDTNKYENMIGIAGQFMSIAKGGMDASSVLIDGPNGQCLSVSVSDACESFWHRYKTVAHISQAGICRDWLISPG